MGRRLLVIDDEPDIRRIVQLSLARVAGWTVLAAASGREGVALAGADPPDAILLDAMMPGLDGAATLALLRESEATRAVPVIFLTAKLHGPERAHLATLQASGFLAKPFNPLHLAEQIREVLGWET